MLKHGIAAGALLAATLAVGPAKADAVADFFRTRTVNILIGYGPGGGYDTYARILARHLGKYIPGNPNVLPQNMPGAGSMKVANYIYNAAPKDGTALGMFSAQTALEPLFGNKQAKFETVKFAWIGNMTRDVASCGAWRTTGIASLQDLLKSEKDVLFGSTGSGTTTGQHALILKSMLGAKVRIISGYKGIKDIGLAMAQGEVHASCGMVQSAIHSAFESDLQRGDLKIFVQFGHRNVPLFGNATNFYTMIKNDEDRTLADLFFGQSEISRPIAGPPGMPPATVAVLRKAMMDALKDPGMIADAHRTRNEIIPMTGDEVTRMFAAFYATPPALVKKAMAIMDRK